MTDNGIIKALECMCEQIIGDCDECQFYKHIDDDCSKYVIEPALDLINRQKAEIERLQETILMITKTGRFYGTVRADAIKEFAERLKENAKSHYFDDVILSVEINDFDNLVKEMVGDV